MTHHIGVDVSLETSSICIDDGLWDRAAKVDAGKRTRGVS
jgi:hypothetical protein